MERLTKEFGELGEKEIERVVAEHTRQEREQELEEEEQEDEEQEDEEQEEVEDEEVEDEEIIDEGSVRGELRLMRTALQQAKKEKMMKTIAALCKKYATVEKVKVREALEKVR